MRICHHYKDAEQVQMCVLFVTHKQSTDNYDLESNLAIRNISYPLSQREVRNNGDSYVLNLPQISLG